MSPHLLPYFFDHPSLTVFCDDAKQALTHRDEERSEEAALLLSRMSKRQVVKYRTQSSVELHVIRYSTQSANL